MQGESKYDREHYEPRSYETDGEIELASYTCPSCGAEITGDDTMGSTVCPYCGDAAVIKGQFEGTLRPDYIIPFKTDKKAAIEAFEADFKNAPFLPDEFKVKKKIEEMTGVYVPFWMFDCDCSAAITYGAQMVTSWSDSNYHYTKTDYYRLFRSGSVGFANIPVDGSKKADDAQAAADDIYDYNGYGYGENYDGILFYIADSEREYHFSVCGSGETIFNENGLKYLEKIVVPFLKEDNYYAAVKSYADHTEELLEMAAEGKPFNKRQHSMKYILCVVAGALLPLILAYFMMHKKLCAMKTAVKEDYAGNYMKPNSMNLDFSRDIFLYSTVTKTKNRNQIPAVTHRLPAEVTAEGAEVFKNKF